ncbi:MAG: hypothetical protein IT285_07810 [Bdellovibrionales bacterium]|nr:hypothetical protein [Bdellovibrionales bacterium]
MKKKTKSKKPKTSRKPKKAGRALVSPKRVKEIEDTFRALNLPVHLPYEGAEQTGNSLKRFSLYETDGFSFSTSNKITG